MTKLSQIIAIEKGVKSRVYGEITSLDKLIQKPDLFNGLQREYSPFNDDGEKFPSENQRVQANVKEILARVERLSTEYFDVNAKREWTNGTARADIVVDSETLVKQVPVGYLLFLEKQLTDISTMIGRLPLLNEGDEWSFDPAVGLHRSSPTESMKTKKNQRAIVKYPATPEHPAQTEMITEDIAVGKWKQTKQSGAIGKPARQEMLDRVEKLLIAVKFAREAANMADVVDTPAVGEALFGYIFP